MRTQRRESVNAAIERPGSVCSNIGHLDINLGNNPLLDDFCELLEQDELLETAEGLVLEAEPNTQGKRRVLAPRKVNYELPPTVNGEPVKVYCTTVVKNISRIDAVGESAYLVFSANMYWYDHRIPKLRLSPSGILPRSMVALWRPGFTFPQGEKDVFVSTAPAWQDVRVEDHENGLLSTWSEFKGNAAMQIDLQHFPFDECKLECRLTGGRLRDGTPSNKHEFIFMDSPPPEPRFENLSFLNLVPLDFVNRCSHRMVGLYTKNLTMGDVSTLTMGFVLRRNSNFFLWRCLFVLWALFLCSLSAYSIDARQMGSRVEVSATLLVGAMAVLFTFSSDMPKTGSLNRLDYLFISTIVMMILPVIETAIVSRYLVSQEEGMWPETETTEHALDVSRNTDYIVGALSVLLYTGLNVFFWFLPSRKLNKNPYVPQNGVPEAWKYMPWSVANGLKFCRFTPQQSPKSGQEQLKCKQEQLKGTKPPDQDSSNIVGAVTVHNNSADGSIQTQSVTSASSPATVHPN